MPCAGRFVGIGAGLGWCGTRRSARGRSGVADIHRCVSEVGSERLWGSKGRAVIRGLPCAATAACHAVTKVNTPFLRDGRGPRRAEEFSEGMRRFFAVLAG